MHETGKWCEGKGRDYNLVRRKGENRRAKFRELIRTRDSKTSNPGRITIRWNQKRKSIKKYVVIGYLRNAKILKSSLSKLDPKYLILREKN